MIDDRIAGTDLYFFNEGTHRRVQRFLGAHPRVISSHDGSAATACDFAVWAPNARHVQVVGETADGQWFGADLEPVGSSGVRAATVDGVGNGAHYVYRVTGADGGVVDRADPCAFRTECPPRTRSVVDDLAYRWHDDTWMRSRGAHNALDAPMAIYEVHLGSFLPRPADRSFPNYREIGERLAEHVLANGFTHVELLPVMEHPFYGSWGYQTTSYFAPTSRYGTPQDLMAMIDHLHQCGIGVLLDWVPSHFPTDAFALARFDGTHLYEHADPRLGHHPDWHSAIFNYGRHEVRSFLLSSALFWLERYHADGLRVDAVASMLYRDYSRREGEWIPNEYGGRENLEAISLLRDINTAVFGEVEGITTVAEESTAWPGVSRPVYNGGLGFGYKWDMGWMHDTLQYLRRDPVARKWHQNDLSFRGLYYAAENYVLPLSHDEVVHGKGSLIGQMAGDDWQKRANLRLLFGWQLAQPGKKLVFAGGELAQPWEWSHEGHVPMDLLGDPRHEGIRRFVADANRLYRGEPALHELDCDPGGFQWVSADDAEQSVYALLRWGRRRDRCVLAVLNATPVPRENYRVGVPLRGEWREVLNSDAVVYGGSGVGNMGAVRTFPVPSHGHWQSLVLTLPPLAIAFFVGGAP